MNGYESGLDRLCRLLAGDGAAVTLDPELTTILRQGRLGLLTHHAAIDRHLTPAVEALPSAGARLAALFGPEHGVRGAAAAGEHVASGLDARTGLPIHSLYGANRRPSPEMLGGLDALLVDLQDVGARFYTYAATLSLVMQAAAEVGLPVVILDRANPAGGRVVEGPVLEPAYASFVGPHPAPIRHGMTMGELARLFHQAYGVGAAPHVVPLAGWERDLWPASRPWAPPSPNVPTPETALLYPGTGLLEGTNLSEGRGTTKPFEWVGAPWIDPEAWRDRLEALELPGVRFRPVTFVPALSKHAGLPCGGVQVHLIDRDGVRAVAVGAALLWTARHLWPAEFRWLERDGGWKIDLLAGTDRLRREIENAVPLDTLLRGWEEALERFEPLRCRSLLYGSDEPDRRSTRR
jgi:uncharacterized protein YbbC (DUF1343 family)